MERSDLSWSDLTGDDLTMGRNDCKPLVHGCRCSDGDAPNQLHFNCPCVVCNGKAVSLMTAWRDRVKNRKLNVDPKYVDS